MLNFINEIKAIPSLAHFVGRTSFATRERAKLANISEQTKQLEKQKVEIEDKFATQFILLFPSVFYVSILNKNRDDLNCYFLEEQDATKKYEDAKRSGFPVHYTRITSDKFASNYFLYTESGIEQLGRIYLTEN